MMVRSKELHQQPGKGRVLLIAPQPFYEERGTPMNVRLMCTVLARAGYQVDLVAFPTGRDLEIAGVRLIRLPNILATSHIPIGFSWKKMVFDLLLPLWCGSLCLVHRYAVIHGVEEGGVLAVALGRLCKKSGTIFDMDSVMSAQFGSKGALAALVRRVVAGLEQWAMGRAELILTVCEALSEEARSVQPGARIVQIEDIPLEFAFPLEREEALRAEAAVAQAVAQYRLGAGKMLLYTGNLQSYQGIELLLEAWGLFMADQGGEQPCQLVIVGGPAELAARLQEGLAGRSWAESVCFTGPRPAAEMSAWMELAHGLISPRSQGENTPLKLYTYMATAKPIIATRMRTHTQVLSDETAFLVAAEPRAMAREIGRVLGGAAAHEGARRGAAARALVREQFSYQIFTKKLLQAYAQATGQTSNG
ncbi:glycosyltransferase family 4 protein [Desulfogranum mediterraneum]|uniref:glycosyltransferase family 4 protein n=1 Tax=Desulfogranum mediterraneum TaxID=160661 RepID=UPI000406B222|nr:glycosyltransferase family 4 protein [Desulfogranum mediterraneum]